MPLLHLTNGTLVWTKLIQWGRLLPVCGNTGSHLLSCLSSRHSWFTSQSRRTSSALRLCLLLGKGRAKRMATCTEWRRPATSMGQICPRYQPALPCWGRLSEIPQLCAGCQSKLLHGESTHHWKQSHGHPKNCLCSRYCGSTKHCRSRWF